MYGFDFGLDAPLGNNTYVCTHAKHSLYDTFFLFVVLGISCFGFGDALSETKEKMSLWYVRKKLCAG